jgi:hypothetical protein
MGIDKSIRQYYETGMLVKKRADGKRPGYRGRTSSGMDMSGATHRGGTTSSYSSDRPDPPAPSRTQTMKEQEWATGSYTPPAPDTTPDTGTVDAREKRRTQQYIVPKTYEDVTIHGQQGPVPTFKRKTYSPTYYQDKYSPPKDTGGIMSKIGSGLKTAAKIALPFIAPPLAAKLGLGKAYQIGKLGYNIQQGNPFGTGWKGKIAQKIGLTDKINAATKNLTKTQPKVLGVDKFGNEIIQRKKQVEQRTEGDRDDLAKVVAGQGDVVSKAINQFKGTEVETQLAALVKNDLNKALHYYAKMTPNIEAGKASQQEMDAYELLGKYLVQAAPTKQNNRNYI